jgi:UDP-N-acetylmuramyl pentapeptide phosphotransferase/UDP-N-acetylglucosamine-1-phosphate transferase
VPAAVAIASFAISAALAALLVSRFGRLVLDRPNERSLHERPVPRTGGLAVLAGALVSVGFGATPLWLLLALGYVLAAVSFIDDLRGLPTGVRFAAHIVAAALVVWYATTPIDALAAALLVLAVAWITNLYNFMDGSDGLAGGMALIGFGAYAAAAGMAGDGPLLVVSLALAGAAAGFLCFNFPPARIFLGDVGSVPLGFFAGALGIVGWRDDVWPLWFPLLVFAPFIGDATLTLLRRLVRGERVWQAHREHYYQRLVRLGAGHRGTALAAYALMLVCAAAALYARDQAPAVQALAFAAACAVLLGAGAWIDVRWARQLRAGQAPT